MELKSTGYIKRIDDLGRITIPKTIRQQIFGENLGEYMQMEFFMSGENIVLCKHDENACIWKYSSHTGKITSNIHNKNIPDSIAYDWETCPYCGKKMTVISIE